MRLLYVCSDFGIKPDGTKGASVHLCAITRGLANLGHDVSLLTPCPSLPEDHPARLLLADECPKVREPSRLLKKWLRDRGLDKGVAREVRSMLYSARVVERAQKAYADNPPEAVIERLSLFSHVGVDIADSLHVPLIVEVNAPLTSEAGVYRSLQLQPLAAEIERHVLERADAIVTVSEPLANLLSRAGIPRKKIEVIPNGVDMQEFDETPSKSDCRTRFNLNGHFTVGFSGSLKAWHGVDVLLTAFARLHAADSHTRLLIVGSGPEEEDLQSRVKEMRLESAVHFSGAVDHDRVPAYLKAMDVAVAPFKSPHDGCFYFSPIKLFEYMAAGTCVVASKLGQIQQVIKDGVNGVLCKPDDAESLLHALRTAQHACRESRQMGEAAQVAVRNNYTWSHAARKTEEIVFHCLHRRRKVRGGRRTHAKSCATITP